MSAYLSYATDNQGKLSLVWSKTPVPGALLEAIPKKKVPDFKYTTNRGTTDMMINLQEDKKKYFQGFVSFVKAVRPFDCHLKLLSEKGPLPFQVVLLAPDNAVTKLTPTELDLRKFTCVAAVPKDSQDYNVKSLDRLLFISKAAQGGGAADPI